MRGLFQHRHRFIAITDLVRTVLCGGVGAWGQFSTLPSEGMNLPIATSLLGRPGISGRILHLPHREGLNSPNATAFL